MKIARPLLSSLLLLMPLGALAQADEAPVTVDASHYIPALREKIEAAARQGPTALLHFCERTRMIYNLRATDLARSPQDRK